MSMGARPILNGDASERRGYGESGAGRAEVGAAMLYVSTDYVFDGSGGKPWREDDATNPLSAYGQSKLKGERPFAAAAGPALDCSIVVAVRPGGKNFVSTILKLAAQRDELRVVSDQRGSPTYTRHLARNCRR